MLALALAALTVTADPLVVDARLGPAYLMKARSHAVAYLFKPAARLGVRRAVGARLELGGALDALLESSAHYRVLGLLAHARYALLAGPVFSLGVGGALGAGRDADILHASLRAGGTVAPYGFLALDGRWAAGDRWLAGVEVAWESLALAHLGLTVGCRFP